MKNFIFIALLTFILGISTSCFNKKEETQTTHTQKVEKKENKPSQEQQDDDKDNGLIKTKWGSRFYKAHKGKIEAIEHIWLRHNYNSTYSNVSRFGKEYKDKEAIKKLVEKALKRCTKDDISMEAGGHKTVTTDMKKEIGLSQKGKPTTLIRIHLDNKDYVKTAYPY